MSLKKAVVWYDIYDEGSDELMRVEGFIIEESRRTVTVAQISKPVIINKRDIVKIQEIENETIVKL